MASPGRGAALTQAPTHDPRTVTLRGVTSAPVGGEPGGIPLRVLVVTGDDPQRFRALGGGDPTLPRHELAYPYYGALLEAGCSVEVVPLSYRSPASLRRVARRLGDFDVAIGWSMEGAMLALAATPYRANRKVVTVAYANRRPRRNRWVAAVRDLVFWAGLRVGGLTLYVTRQQADEAQADFRLLPRRTGYCQVGVDAEFFAPAPAHAGAPLAPDVRRAAQSPYVVVAGDQQRDESLTAAVVRGTGLRLVRLTQEPGTQRLWERRRAEDAGLADVFCRAGLSFAEVRYLYQRALCVLNLVDNSWQPAGLTVAKESMACGVPLIMNRGLTTRELGRHARAAGQPPFREVASLTAVEQARAAVLKLAGDPAYVSSVGRAGRRLIEEGLDLRTRAWAPLRLLQRHVAATS